MSFQMKKLTPNIMVENVNQTIQFYRDILGFELVVTVPEQGQFDWAMLKLGGVDLMLQSRTSLTQELPRLKDIPIGGSLTFYINVDDIEAFHAAIKERVTIVQEMHKTFYNAQEFAIQDNNGYILVFAENV